MKNTQEISFSADFFLLGLQPLFAFKYLEKFPEDGWKVYDPIAEYKRLVKHVNIPKRFIDRSGLLTIFLF